MTLQNNQKIEQVIEYFQRLGKQLCMQFESFETDQKFRHDAWQYDNGGGGLTRLIENGDVFERVGVNFSHIFGKQLPPSATLARPEIAGLPFQAMGVSLVAHPFNPYVPTCHLNVRFFFTTDRQGNEAWWFGGGYDLTPYYGFTEDCVHWHRIAKEACDPFSSQYYEKFKHQCDAYFHLKHRNEQRGIGGLFFDDFNSLGFADSFEFIQSIGNSFSDAYFPIVERRRNTPYSSDNKDFQHHRRGRYVEFNLIYDRGTLFGLQSNGRTESILMSMPPKVAWSYQYPLQQGSAEQELVEFFLQPQDWLHMEDTS